MAYKFNFSDDFQKLLDDFVKVNKIEDIKEEGNRLILSIPKVLSIYESEGKEIIDEALLKDFRKNLEEFEDVSVDMKFNRDSTVVVLEFDLSLEDNDNKPIKKFENHVRFVTVPPKKEGKIKDNKVANSEVTKSKVIKDSNALMQEILYQSSKLQ